MTKKERYITYPFVACTKESSKEGSYIGAAEMMDDGQKTLVFTVFKNSKPLIRIFLKKDRYTTQCVSEGKFSSAMIGKLLKEDHLLEMEIDEESLRLVETFTGGLSIDDFQQKIIDEKREKKWKKIIKEGQQEWIPAPKGLIKSARENANPNERYYFFSKGEGGHCSVCGHSFVHENVRPKDEVKCPHCKRMLKAVNLKMVRSGTSLTYWRGTGLIYPQAIKGHLVLTEYEVVNHYENGEIHPKCYPLNRIILKDGKSVLFKRNQHDGKSYWGKTNTPRKPYGGQCLYYYLKRFERFYDKKALNRCLKKLKIAEYITAVEKIIGSDDEAGEEVMKIFYGDYDKKEVQMLLKSKMYNLAGHVIFKGIKCTCGAEFDEFEGTYYRKEVAPKQYSNVQELLGIEKKDISFLIQNDLTQHEFIFYKRYLQHGLRLKKKELNLIRENQWILNYVYRDLFLDAIFTKKIGLERMVNYIKKRNHLEEDTILWNGISKGISSVCIELKDYWRLAENNMEDVVWLPSDLTAAHNNQVSIAENKKSRMKKEKLRRIVSKIRKLEYDDFSFVASNGLVFTPFSSLLDIYKEGKTNHNCIYQNYKNDYANGKDVLLSIRKDKDTPYFAMEIQNGSVVQVRGMMNKGPNQEVCSALLEYIQAKPVCCPRYIVENQ